MATLRMTAETLVGIRTRAQAEAPNESCGILLGRTNAADLACVTFLPAANSTANNPTSHYAIAPQDLVRAEKEARHRGLSIIGFYHSHPNGSAHWSKTDLEEAHWPGCVHLILGFNADRANALKAFLLVGEGASDKAFIPVNLKLMSN